MKDKLKIYGPIILSALLFYMMIDTPHSRALGDIVLETLGLEAWTYGNQGIHLTVVYFAVLFFLVIFASRFIPVDCDISKKRRIFVFVGTVLVIYLAHSTIIHDRMEQLEGLQSMVIAPSGGSYEYKIAEGEVEEFLCEVELRNYSEEARQFTIIDINDSATDFQLYDKQGAPVQFVIPGKETRKYRINHNDYILKHLDLEGRQPIAGKGTIDKILLQDSQGNKVTITKLNHRRKGK